MKINITYTCEEINNNIHKWKKKKTIRRQNSKKEYRVHNKMIYYHLKLIKKKKKKNEYKTKIMIDVYDKHKYI